MKNKPELTVDYQTIFILPTSLNKEIVIAYSLSELSDVKIMLYEALGKVIKKITNEIQVPGEYKINMNVEGLANGIYYIKRSTQKIEPSKKQKMVEKLIDQNFSG